MSRRVTLPGADELFRATDPQREGGGAGERGDDRPQAAAVRQAPHRVGRGERRPTGRERHEEKITVYCSADELIELEQARLVLRREHALGVDRGRIVREAIAVVLADLEAKGEDSILVRRLRDA